MKPMCAVVPEWRNQNSDWNQHFFSESKFSETENETFFRDQIFQNQNRHFFSKAKFSKTEPRLFFETKISETLQKLAKVSRPRLLNIFKIFWEIHMVGKGS